MADPTITGTKSSSTTSEAPVMPFSGVTVTDPNTDATETLTIKLGGQGGTLSGAGLHQQGYEPPYGALYEGPYSLTGTASQVTAELDALSFTPSATFVSPGVQTSTTFTLTDQSSAGTSVADSTTTVTNTASPNTVTIYPTVTSNGTLMITGSVLRPVGIASVEVSALVDGQTQDLGTADLLPRSDYYGPQYFSFTDHVGPTTQSFITVTETDRNGSTASAVAPFEFTAGIKGRPYVAQQDSYDPDTGTFTGQTFFNRDGSVVYRDTYTANGDGTSSYNYSDGTFFNGKRYSSFTELYGSDGTLLTETRERNDGSRAVIVDAPAQSVDSGYYDTFRNQNQPDTNFVFSPGFGYDQVHGFMAAGGGHDVLDLPASDFTNIADVLRHTQDTGGGAVINDPTSGDAILVAGVSKDELVHNRQDFSFHA